MTQPKLYEFLSAAEACASSARRDDAEALSHCAALDDFMDRTIQSRMKVPVASLLRLSARSMYCAAIRTALTGYRAALFPTLRASLEAVCYAQEIEVAPNLADVWLNRHKDEGAHKACRKAFGKAVSHTSKRFSARMPDNPDFVMQIYDSMIDDGAHPNVRSIVRAIRFTETDSHHEVSVGLVVPEAVEIALYCCFEIGLFTSWLMADPSDSDRAFWEEAMQLNEIKERWGEKLLAAQAAD